MNSSMADYLKVVTPHLHHELVSPLALSSIQALAQLLPPFSVAGFECRLGAEQSRVDFQVNLPHPKTNLPENLLSSPVWQFFQDFCWEWAEPTSFLHKSVDNLWLEFDLEEKPSQIPIPCIFLALNQQKVSETQGIMSTALRLLNDSTSSVLESNLRLCINSLPSGANITHLGAMLSRTTKTVRVNVKGIPPEQLLDYLTEIGWTDTQNTFSPVVSNLTKLVDEIVLTFDVGETIHPRIGLECFLEKQPINEPRWQLFLGYLVDQGLCSPTKKNAFLAWHGFSQKSDQPELWPKNLDWGNRFLGSKALSLFWRAISLIKIVYQPGSPLEAKGYLAFGHRWFDSSTLTREELPKIEETEVDTSQYLEQVRSYYDTMNPLILKDVGTTYQSGLLMTDSETNAYHKTNLYCAAQAGIQSGHHVLDAGCGVCGPSIDIAQNIQGVRIDAITLSPAQANTARELVQQAGLTDRIQVHIGDFHHLPFADNVFDLVFFFESSGYSYNYQLLFSEVYRVLRPGGSLYIKEPFRKESPLSAQEQQELAEFNRVYVYKTALMSEIIEAISAVGFQKVISRDLSDIFSTQEFNKSIIQYKYGFPILTEFGKFHCCQFQCLPIFFGEIKACKPR